MKLTIYEYPYLNSGAFKNQLNKANNIIAQIKNNCLKLG